MIRIVATAFLLSLVNCSHRPTANSPGARRFQIKVGTVTLEDRPSTKSSLNGNFELKLNGKGVFVFDSIRDEGPTHLG